MADNRTITPGGFNYTGLRDNTAEKLLARFGKTATLNTPGGAGADPWDPPVAGTDYDITVVGPDYKLNNRELTTIEEAALKFIVSTDGATVPPALNCTITLDGSVFQIVGVDPLQPGSVTMLYTVYCRK